MYNWPAVRFLALLHLILEKAQTKKPDLELPQRTYASGNEEDGVSAGGGHEFTPYTPPLNAECWPQVLVKPLRHQARPFDSYCEGACAC